MFHGDIIATGFMVKKRRKHAAVALGAGLVLIGRGLCERRFRDRNG